MKTKLFALALAASMLGCQKGGGNEQTALTESDNYIPQTQKEVSEKNENRTSAEPFAQRKLIKNAELNFETDNISTTHQKIVAAAEKAGGYIANEESYNEYNRVSQHLTVRIPQEKFDSFLAAVSKGVAHFDTRHIDVQDVTGQYFDLKARLETKKALEQRYIQLLEKAKTVEDILKIEREIANLRSDIEVMEGRKKSMENQISLSTVRINFYTVETTAERGPEWANKFGKGFVNGWQNIMLFAVGLVNIWPFLLIILGATIWLRKKWKGRNKK